MQKYEFVNAKDCFDDNNNGYIFGIHLLDEDNIVDAEWFKTKKERLNAIYREDYNEHRRNL